MTRVNKGRKTAIVRRVYRERESRFHLDDLRPYVQGQNDQKLYDPKIPYFLGEKEAPTPVYHVERSAMKGAILLGQRSLDLIWPL